jgi:hypothetical protein
MKIITHVTQQASYAAALAVTGLGILMIMHVVAEPQIGHSQTEVFTIRQTITDETSFLVPPTDVIMDGSISGITGGQATGSSQFVVQTNNAAGYRVDISFAGSPTAMVGDVSGSIALRNYGNDVGGQPSRGYVASTTAAQFAYTVTSSSTLDTDDSFLHDGATCNVALGASTVACWKAPSTAPFTIADRNSSAINGATTTVTFNVTVPNAALPVPEAETYTATATLSLFTL